MRGSGAAKASVCVRVSANLGGETSSALHMRLGRLAPAQKEYQKSMKEL